MSSFSFLVPHPTSLNIAAKTKDAISIYLRLGFAFKKSTPPPEIWHASWQKSGSQQDGSTSAIGASGFQTPSPVVNALTMEGEFYELWRALKTFCGGFLDTSQSFFSSSFFYQTPALGAVKPVAWRFSSIRR